MNSPKMTKNICDDCLNEISNGLIDFTNTFNNLLIAWGDLIIKSDDILTNIYSAEIRKKLEGEEN